MPSTTIYERWDVVVVNVPFTDQSGAKARPALVVSDQAFHKGIADLIVCPISSRPLYHERPGPGDCPLLDWRAAGLRHPSTVRISKMLAVDKGLIKTVLRRLPESDRSPVESGLRRAFGFDRRR